MKASILTTWKGSGSQADPYRPSILEEHLTIVSFVDATNQPAANLLPSPNLYLVTVVCDAATLAEIEADVNYFVLWSE